MQGFKNAFEIKRSATQNNLYKNLMVTAKQKSIIDIHTKRKRNPNITLKIVIKSQEKRTKEEREERPTKTNLKINKMAIRTYIWIITLNVNGISAPAKRQIG